MNDLAPAEVQQLALSAALLVADIHPSPTNPRKTFPEDAHAEMVKTVLRHGVMQPILVRPWPEKYKVDGTQPKYELIAGERRYRAAKDAGLIYIPGTVRDLDDHETIELQIIENLHRKDLNELEEAEGYELAMKQFGYSAEQLAERIEKSKAYIYARLKLTALCKKARDAFRNGQLDASRALLIARIPLASLQARAVKEITEGYGGPWAYRQAAEWIQRNYMLKLAEAPFPRADESLVADAGKCHPCPKRTGSNPELYPDVKSADICTDPECFAAKKAAWMERQKVEAEATGKAVITGDEARKIMPYGPDNDLQHYVVLDRPNYSAPQADGKHPTHRQLLADAKVGTMMVEDHRTGKLIEVAKRSEIKKAMEAAGIAAPPSTSDRNREAETQAKEEGEFRRRLYRQVRAAFLDDINEHDPVLDEDDMRLIARQFWSCTWQENQKRIAAIWIDSEEKLSDYERAHELTKRIDTMTPPELCLLLIDLSLIGQTQINTYSSESTPTHLMDIAKRLAVSPDTIRREILVEKEEKAAKKGKAGKGAKTPFKAGTIGDYVEVIAYPCNAKLIGSIGQVASVGNCIATGKPIYTLTLADGHTLNAEAAELATSTAEAFAAQQEQRNPEGEPATAEVQPETALSASDFQAGDRIRIKPDSDLTDAGKAGTFHSYDSEAGEALVSIDGVPALLRCYPDEMEQLPAEETLPAGLAFKTGDRVRISPDANTNGFKLEGAGKDGEVIKIDVEYGEAVISIDGDGWRRGIPFKFIERTDLDTNTGTTLAADAQPAARKTTSKAEILYQHPHNPGLQWTGRGRKPKWVEHWLETGTLEQLLAKKRPAHKPKGGQAVATSAACEISMPRCDKTLELPGVTLPNSQPSA